MYDGSLHKTALATDSAEIEDDDPLVSIPKSRTQPPFPTGIPTFSRLLFEAQRRQMIGTARLHSREFSHTPMSLFQRFFSEDMKNTVSENTNKYAGLKLQEEGQKRPWWPATNIEVKGFLRVLLYMGLHKEACIEDY